MKDTCDLGSHLVRNVHKQMRNRTPTWFSTGLKLWSWFMAARLWQAQNAAPGLGPRSRGIARLSKHRDPARSPLLLPVQAHLCTFAQQLTATRRDQRWAASVNALSKERGNTLASLQVCFRSLCFLSLTDYLEFSNYVCCTQLCLHCKDDTASKAISGKK